jgi:hypothetical protein
MINKADIDDLLMVVDLMIGTAKDGLKYNTTLIDVIPFADDTARAILRSQAEDQYRFLLSQIQRYVEVAKSIQEKAK